MSFGGGGFFGSGAKQSKSSSNITTTTTTQNAGFSEIDGDAAAIQGSNNTVLSGDRALSVGSGSNTVNVLDADAIKQAFNFAETASSNAAGSVSESIAAVTEGARAETENIVYQLKTLGIWAVVAFAGVKIFQALKG